MNYDLGYFDAETDRIDQNSPEAVLTLRASRLSPLRRQLLSQLVEQRPPPWAGHTR
jgi:hypothetical protein